MTKRISSVIILSVILFLSMTTLTVTSTASPLQVTKLMEKPPWAGSPGGPNGDGDDETPTTYELNIEIDYVVGHEPTPEVLAYITDYYYDQGIDVTFYADGYPDASDNYVISQEVSLIDEEGRWDAGDGISEDEFEAIEDFYNNNDQGYFDNWKWVLFGTTVTTVEGPPDVVGYCWVAIQGKDVLAGNYIYIADEAADDWATIEGIDLYGAEAVVLMHEMGHSIGIGKIDRIQGGIYEVYDPDLGSVMSWLTEDNALLYWDWYYGEDYWATRNMKYYKEEIIA